MRLDTNSNDFLGKEVKNTDYIVLTAPEGYQQVCE